VPSLHPTPTLDYYFKACRKGDPEAKAVTVNPSSVRAIADVREITGLPRNNFEVHEISKAELGPFVQKSSRPAFVTSADSAPSLAASDPQA
jgi:hypothetical protein